MKTNFFMKKSMSSNDLDKLPFTPSTSVTTWWWGVIVFRSKKEEVLIEVENSQRKNTLLFNWTPTACLHRKPFMFLNIDGRRKDLGRLCRWRNFFNRIVLIKDMPSGKWIPSRVIIEICKKILPLVENAWVH